MFKKLHLTCWFIPALCAALLVQPQVAVAQDAEQLLFTVGTTGKDAAGDDFGYMVLQAQRAEAIIGRPYAIYEKAAGFETAAPFRLRAVIQLQTNPQTIRSILNASAAVDEQFDMLSRRVDGFFEDVNIESSGASGADLDLAEKVSLAVRSAQAKPELFEGLYFLGRLHPGMNAVLGLGYFGELDVPLATWEIREWNPAAEQAEQVVGRVLLDKSGVDPALGYDPLPAPGRPIDVPFPESDTTYAKDPRGHLNVRLRWPTPSDLQEASLLALGYDVYRLPAAVAVDLGLADEGAPEARAPSIDMAKMLLDGGMLVQTNVFPIMPESDLSEAQANDPTDSETFFVADDDDRFEPGAEGSFSDGDEFYYFVAAQDLLRRSGQISAGHYVKVCAQMPPLPVDEVQVRNFFEASLDPAEIDTYGGDQHLEVRWRQVIEDEVGEAVDDYKYYIYRWESPQEMLAEAANPLTNLVAGPIDHDSTENWGSWIDTPSSANRDSPAFPDDAGRTYYYTVRVEDSSACGGNLSGNSAPVYGVLRDRRPLEDPTGAVLSRCLELVFENRGTELFERNPRGAGADTFVRVVVRRDNPDIEWAALSVDFGKGTPLDPVNFDRRYFPEGSDFVFFDLLPEAAFGELRLQLSGGDRFGKRVNAPLEVLGQGDPRSPRGVELFYELRHEETLPGDAGSGDCGPHVLIDRSVPGGRIVPPMVELEPPERAREYKLYRRVNDGNLSLVAQGETDDLFADLADFSFEDFAMPSAPAYTICYFLQVFDEHGNASALVQIGECIDFVREYPAPLLGAPELYTGPGGETMARFTWYCAPDGVDKFELWVAAESGGDPGPLGSDLSAWEAAPVFRLEDDPSAYRPYQTRRVGSSFGQDAPEYSIDVELDPNEAYRFYVRAVGEGPFDSRLSGPLSNLQTIAWSEPPAELGPDVAWPDRDLPGLLEERLDRAFNGPFAMELLRDNFNLPYPVLHLGQYTLFDTELNELITYDQQQQLTEGFNSFLMPEGDPIDWTSHRVVGRDGGDSSVSKSIFPFALYRYRIDAPLLRESSRIVEQVTPLIREIAYEDGVTYDIGKPGGDTIQVNRIRDPFFESRVLPEYAGDPQAGYSGSGPTHNLYLVDHSPLQLGGTYQYLVVFFTERGEIETILPLNPIEISATSP